MLATKCRHRHLIQTRSLGIARIVAEMRWDLNLAKALYPQVCNTSLAELRTRTRLRLSLSLKAPLAKNRDGFFARDFAPQGLLMNGFILGVWNIALVLEAPDDASGIAGFFGCGTGVFRCLTHESYSLAG
jgi:hypothetical protein